MSDTTNDIDALLAALDWGPGALTNEEMLDRSHSALTALVAERDALKQRVAELEAEPSSELSFCERRDRAWAEELRKPAPADRDRELRERLVCAIWPQMLRSFDQPSDDGSRYEWQEVKAKARKEALDEANKMLAAMRKENDNA